MKNELVKLASLLTNAKIPFEFNSIFDEDDQICYPSYDNRICDAVCHKISYGHEKGLLEIMGLVDEEVVGDTVEGWLTAEEVFKRIEADYKSR